MLKHLLVSVAIAVAFATFSPASARAEEPPVRMLSLTGKGEVLTRPDMALITLGVVSRATAARAALDTNNAAMSTLLAALKTAGIDRKDIQTANFTVNPVYEYANDNKEPPKITGYEVSNQVGVAVRKLDQLGAILDQAVSTGSNQIFGIAFTVADPQPLLDKARTAAVADAMRKAKIYAQSAGITLDQILTITEQVIHPPQPVMMQAKRMDAAAEVPIAEGEQTIAVEVNMAWTIH